MKKGAEVVVVGGGIIGCSVAAELAGRGAEVLLLERAELAHGASGRNHGLVYYPQSLITAPLYRESFLIYQVLADSSPVDIGFDEKPFGLVVLTRNDDEWALAEAEANACVEGDVAVERWDRDQLREAEPEVSHEYEGAWYIDDGYRSDPRALTLAMAMRAKERGAEVVTHVDVKQISTRSQTVKGVFTDQGFVEAKTLVLAGGPWLPKLARTAGVDVPVGGVRGWLLLTQPGRPMLNHLVESAGWHVQSGDPGPAPVSVGSWGGGDDVPADVGLLLQPGPNDHLLMGGSRLASLSVDPEGRKIAREIARRAALAVPALADAPILEVWSGVRPTSPDGIPLIGWAEEVEGLLIAGGHGGQGVMLGAGSARLVAELIRGEQPFTDPKPFDVGRSYALPTSPSADQSAGGGP